MSDHTWVEMGRRNSPNSSFRYYRCTECGVYRAQPVEGKLVTAYSEIKYVGSWSMVPYGEYNLTEADMALDDALSELDVDYPTCTDILGIRMGEALG